MVTLEAEVALLEAERESLAEQVAALEAAVEELEAEVAALERTVVDEERRRQQATETYERLLAQRDRANQALRRELDAASSEPGTRSVSAVVRPLRAVVARAKRLSRRR